MSIDLNKPQYFFKIYEINNYTFPFKVETSYGKIITLVKDVELDCECGDDDCQDGGHEPIEYYESDDGDLHNQDDRGYIVKDLPEWF